MGTDGDRDFDALICLWLADRGPRIGVQLAAEFTKWSHPVELRGVQDSLHGVLQSQTFTVGSGDFFDAVAVATNVEADEPGKVGSAEIGFFVLGSLYAATGSKVSTPTFVSSPLTVVFRLVAEGDERERLWLLDALEATHRSLRVFVDFNGCGRPDQAAFVNLALTAVKEVVSGELDDVAVERVAEEFDRQQPAGFQLFFEGIMRKCKDRTRFVEALAAMLGERWESPAWQMVRHVLVEPRMW